MPGKHRLLRNHLVIAAMMAFAAWSWLGPTTADEPAVLLPPPALDLPAATGAPTETAVFAGGCFWGVQLVFQHTQGVLRAVSGYAGGRADDAHYDVVGGGRTGHAEAVQVTYDPRRISYGKLLQVFFSVVHDPTQRDRQGPDVGPQYRSAVFFRDAAQRQVAERYIAQLGDARAFRQPIATRLEPLTSDRGFYPAEAEHQDYAARHPEQLYIVRFEMPKLANLKAVMPEMWRDEAVAANAQPALPR